MPAVRTAATRPATTQPSPCRAKVRRTWPRSDAIRASSGLLIGICLLRQPAVDDHQTQSYHLLALPQNPFRGDGHQEQAKDRPGVPEWDRRIGVEWDFLGRREVSEQARGIARRIELP